MKNILKVHELAHQVCSVQEVGHRKLSNCEARDEHKQTHLVERGAAGGDHTARGLVCGAHVAPETEAERRQMKDWVGAQQEGGHAVHQHASHPVHRAQVRVHLAGAANRAFW